MSPTAIARLQLVAAALLFSTGGAAIKATTLTGWQVASFRSGLATVALALAFPSWRKSFTRASWAVGAAFGATMLLFVSANKLTTAANAIFLQSTAPIYLLFLGPRLLGERVVARDVVLTGCIAIGLVCIVAGHESVTLTAPQPVAGNTVAAFSGIAWALTVVGLRWLSRIAPDGTSSRGEQGGAAVLAGNAITFLLVLPMALPIGPTTTTDWLLIGHLGLLQIGLAYVFLTRGLRHLNALEAALLLLLEPVASTLLAWLVHHERPSRLALLGCSLILAATTIRSLRTSWNPGGRWSILGRPSRS